MPKFKLRVMSNVGALSLISSGEDVEEAFKRLQKESNNGVTELLRIIKVEEEIRNA